MVQNFKFFTTLIKVNGRSLPLLKIYTRNSVYLDHISLQDIVSLQEHMSLCTHIFVYINVDEQFGLQDHVCLQDIVSLQEHVSLCSYIFVYIT